MSFGGIGKMFPGTVGAQSRVVSPRIGRRDQGRRKFCKLVTRRFTESINWKVPPNVTLVFASVGSPGVIADIDGQPGDFDSYGMVVGATLTVTPGETLSLVVGTTSVGSTGGTPDGGDGGLGQGSSAHPEVPKDGRGGSGSSRIVQGGNPVVIAGGAGGGYADRTLPPSLQDLQSFGGSAGYPDGSDGEDHIPTGRQGFGGGQSAGGAGGVANPSYGYDGQDGASLQGGDGGASFAIDGTLGGHGGGGGLYGGGGSAGGVVTIGGGGGGSGSDSGAPNFDEVTNAPLMGFIELTWEICN